MCVCVCVWVQCLHRDLGNSLPVSRPHLGAPSTRARAPGRGRRVPGPEGQQLQQTHEALAGGALKASAVNGTVSVSGKKGGGVCR